MQPRTKRQKEVLEFVKHYIESHGYEPSYQQIANHLGVASKAGIAKHIEALENQGLILRSRENGSFKLEINPTKSILELISEIEWLKNPFSDEPDELSLKPLFVPNYLFNEQSADKIRAYRVLSDSMINEHICEDDVALIELRPYPRDGEIVVAFLTNDRKSVMQRYFRAGANIELRPSNTKFQTVVVPADKIEVVGVLRAILRQTG